MKEKRKFGFTLLFSIKKKKEKFRVPFLILLVIFLHDIISDSERRDLLAEFLA